MPVKETKQTEAETVEEALREPGFYAGENGPYLTAADAQAFIDGHLDGKGKVTEVTAE
jgi:hypothetical protein